jgi:hypothetical protein
MDADMDRTSWARVICPVRIRRERKLYRHATNSQPYIKVAGTLYKVGLIRHTDPASVAAVDAAYRQKYSGDPSLPLLLTDEARSTTSLLSPQA